MSEFNFKYPKLKKKTTEISIAAEMKIRGEYELYKRKAGTNEVLEILKFSNLITDNGLQQMGNSPYLIEYCQLGSGNTDPSVTDTALANKHSAVYYTSFSMSCLTTPPCTHTSTIKYTFNPGVVTQPISEIGISPATSGNLFSRTLLKDSNDNPTTLTLQSDEYLDVYYYVKTDPILTDIPFSLDIEGVNYTGIIRSLRVTDNNFWKSVSGSFRSGALIYSLTFPGTMPTTLSNSSTPTGTGVFSSSTTVSYPANSKIIYRTHTWTPAAGAMSVKSVIFSGDYNSPAIGVEFATPIAKSASQTLTLTVSFSWDRV